MTDIREVAEDLANRMKELLQPTPPPPQRAKKASIVIAIIMVLAFLARLMWEIYQAPTYSED